MKYILILLLLTSKAFAQSDTTKIEQYCEMTSVGRLFSAKITIDIDFGEGRSYFQFKDSRVKDEMTGKVKRFKSTVDALNYLGSQGWTLVNAFPFAEGSQTVYHFFFKKIFDRKDLIENTEAEK